MEPLSNPLNDRVVLTEQPPPHRPLTLKLMYPYHNKPEVPDVDAVRKHLVSGGRIGRAELIKLVKDTTMLFNREQNVVQLKLPAIIVGDIHGQFYDLIHMFEKVVDKR